MRAKILLIDDEPTVIAALRRALGTEHEVDDETSGIAALARLQSGERVDLVLCDLMMPGLTGMDIYQNLSATHAATAAHMVFMTGSAFTARAREFLNSGVRCLEKPFEMAELRKMIGSLVKRR